MIERPRRVVLLIDYDNLQICAARDTPGRELQLTPVVQLAQRFGTVIQARAYAEWNLSTERLAVYKAGIEPAFAPVLRTESDRSGKSLADTVMVAEGMDMLWTLSPDVVVLATSDKDLIPLVRVAKQRGAHVVVLGSDFTAIPLREMADDHFTYRQLITDPSGRITAEPGSARQQPAVLPDASRRRSRDRSARGDRTGVTSTATLPAPPAAAPAPARVERPADRPERPERVERQDRDVAPAATVEAVAPVASVAAGDADGQSTGRRRRRRGSRRRTDRLGMTTDGGSYIDGSVGPGDDSDAGEQPQLEITPTTNVLDVAEASSGTVEGRSPNGAVSELEARTPDVAAPRERRPRRTRRTATAESSVEPDVTAAAANGTSAAAEPDRSPEVPSASEVPAPVELPIVSEDDGITSGPRPRTRRVATAGRGRSRRA